VQVGQTFDPPAVRRPCFLLNQQGIISLSQSFHKQLDHLIPPRIIVEDMAEVTINALPKELLESILLNIPIIGLIMFKTINPLWLQIISESPRLQQRLFQQPIPAEEAPAISTYAQLSVQPVWVNPLLQNDFNIRYSETSDSTVDLIPARRRRTTGQGAGSLLASDHLYWSRSIGRFRQDMILENVLEMSAGSDNTLDDLTRRPVMWHSQDFHRPPRSESDFMPVELTENWAAMLATQPPLQLLRLRCEHMDREIDVEPTHGDGITLGDILEAAAELCGDGRRYYIVELNIYQPIDVSPESNGLGFVNGNVVRTQDGVQVHRAWETKLHCQLN
jgi:hypothetical protein